MSAAVHVIARLEFTSTFDMLDCVQAVGDHVVKGVGFDDDTQHWIGLALRESVINAIRHGNRHDVGKHVFVEFSSATLAGVAELRIRVRDEGSGFDPSTLRDPLAPENLLRASGRGIFLIRSFMDSMELRPAPEGGMEMRMTKRVAGN